MGLAVVTGVRIDNNIFGNHDVALMARARRAGVLAANLANADTPNYKARDIDFGSALEGAGAQSNLALATTTALHLGGIENQPAGGDLKYRVPFQASLDGNTVET